jgi:hypothetical protein
MKILLDECVVQEFRHLIVGHDVYTVGYMGWSGTKNGALLNRAAAERFDALVTTDQNIEYQQNLATLPIAVVTLIAPSNDIDDLRPLVPGLLKALSQLAARSLVRVPP